MKPEPELQTLSKEYLPRNGHWPLQCGELAGKVSLGVRCPGGEGLGRGRGVRVLRRAWHKAIMYVSGV